MEPTTARDIVLSLPDRFKKEKAGDFEAVIHLMLEGEGGGEFTVRIEGGNCTVEEGMNGVPDCVIRAAAATYVDAETGKANPAMAVMMGKIKVSDIAVASRFIPLFERLA